jgi:hypothetical protein
VKDRIDRGRIVDAADLDDVLAHGDYAPDEPPDYDAADEQAELEEAFEREADYQRSLREEKE